MTGDGISWIIFWKRIGEESIFAVDTEYFTVFFADADCAYPAYGSTSAKCFE